MSTSRSSRRSPRAGASRRQLFFAALVLLAGIVLVAMSLTRGRPTDPAMAASTDPSASAEVSPPASPLPPVLQLDGDFAKTSTNTFIIGKTNGEILGAAGTVKRFRIAVESNAAAEIDEFTRLVDETLGDPRSWIADQKLRLQRVAEGTAYDFTIYLVTRETAHKMCSINGADIRVDGIPYTSCRQYKKVVINLDRWRLSVPGYVDAGTPLLVYRQYVINHEVGHELGHAHEDCPGPGVPAPTMLQQTLRLNGCLAQPWPYLDGKRYAGKYVP